MPVLDRTTKSAEDLRNPSWRTETGYPSKVMTLDGNRMQLCPPYAGLTPTIGLLEAPVAMDAASLAEGQTPDTPDVRIPVAHHEHLCLGALYLLFSKDKGKKDEARSTKAIGEFMQLIGVADGGGKHLSAGK